MNYTSNTIFDKSTPVVTNIIIINVLMLLASKAFDLISFALFYPISPDFKPYQFVTHMFMHGGIFHLIFNMYALWMFGKILEKIWGSKRFFIYYFVTGLGAAAIYTLVNFIQLSFIESNIDATTLESMKSLLEGGKELIYKDIYIRQWYEITCIPVLGASGAVFGVLLGFGMLFPNTVLRLLFPPIALKAKYFVLIYGAIELYLAINNPVGGGIAHTAHLGGMIFGFILIKIWHKKRNIFY
ncbi:MAG: rhomboid family intramembrane serine protease [Prevotellaceae bacterium]|jgi:membrane associated rhomboid family serine protease|nr:rhomboid family intramembrane serine protease [Prevotellaceae bacterium]